MAAKKIMVPDASYSGWVGAIAKLMMALPKIIAQHLLFFMLTRVLSLVG